MTAYPSSIPWLLGAHGTHAAPHLPLGIGGTLTQACGDSPGIACRLVWDLTHDQVAAQITKDYDLARPVTLALQIVFVVTLALVSRLIVHRTISKVTARAADPGPGLDAGLRLRGERRQQRAQALGSLLRNVSSVVIFGIAGMTIAGYIGLNLAPLLASAGVVGVAIGFGAQSLVRDFISGIFMLLEDQYGVGDIINTGEATGTVEAVSLRTTRLRDVNGMVWHIRNGTISRIGNQSQGWSRAVIDFPVPYQEDLGRVRAVMKEAAAQLWADPHWHELILEEPEVWGVESVYSDAVVMRVVARTLPMRQPDVARELRERLKTALDLPAGAAGPSIAATEGPPGSPPDPAAVPATPPARPAPAPSAALSPTAAPASATAPTAPSAPTVSSSPTAPSAPATASGSGGGTQAGGGTPAGGAGAAGSGGAST